uniref:Uncharacterized protein n=1 Tax=Rhizophora mucronata TaxID=61149 RepID=A0A2P2P9A5_RHIMU
MILFLVFVFDWSLILLVVRQLISFLWIFM